MASSAAVDSRSAAAGASAAITRPLFASREASTASDASSSTSDAYNNEHDLPLSNSTSTLADNNGNALVPRQPLDHASYMSNPALDLPNDQEHDHTITMSSTSYSQQQKQRSFSSSSSSTGTASPSTTILPPTSLSSNKTSGGGSADQGGLGTGTGQVARGGRLPSSSSYPPISEEDDEAREVERNLERWAAEEKQRRKALRASRTNSLLGPPAASALARRLSSLRLSGTPQGRPLSQISTNVGGGGGGGSGRGGDAISPSEQVPLETLADEEGGSSSTHSGSFGRRAGQTGSRRSSGYGPPGPLRKLNGRESVSSLDSYTSSDALTRSVSSNQAALAAAVAIHPAQPVSPDATPTIKQAGFFQSDGSEHVSEGDPASNGTPRPLKNTTAAQRGANGGSGDAINRLKGKGRALDYESDQADNANPNPFADDADEQLNAEGDVSSVSMSLEHDVENPTNRQQTPQLRITPDHSSSSSPPNQQQKRLSRSASSSYASTTLPAYAKPKPSASRPIVTVGREAPATLERQRRDADRGFPSIVATDADAEAAEEEEAARMANKRGGKAGDGGAYSMNAGGGSYGQQQPAMKQPRSSRRLGSRRSHRTIAEGEEDEEDFEDDEGGSDELDRRAGVGTHSAPKRRSTHDSRFNEVGLEDDDDDDENDGERGAEAEWVAAQRRRRRQAAQVQRREEEEELRNGRKMWWTEWLCGCGRHAMDEDEQQHGKTNPMG
ncbi:unnamed protein product [Tilletia controversa]|uniref:Uncharacterized protein n=2 Tax=Tilletia TaxID=13289 RepID=A0A177V3Y8_9BASI|nr:hypothetical protein CF336_g7307 [Tilletia laevis]KAE8261492.1 hypothetical protein A4X03_0g3209 [Tilletia caries]CAD6919221.1 unnamed protein product [Tilletia controversa]KAE8189170.1 hypothetical protein CF335_g6693 [Tilletia laevis]CAD6889725.1 unnamed protein product [Tilletia caries]